ncbi:MAG: MoaD/ThiS family protein [Candidatus Bathyarchaeia archaeon]
MVELFGLARYLAGKREINLNLPDDATLRDVVARLASQTEELLGQVIDGKTMELIEPYTLNINGRYVARDLSVRVNEDDRILLLFTAVGG